MDKFPEPLMYTVSFDHDPLEVPAKPTVDLFTVNPVADDDAAAFPMIIKLLVVPSVDVGYELSVSVKVIVPFPLRVLEACTTDASGDTPNIEPPLGAHRDILDPDVNEYPEFGVKVIDIDTEVPAVSVVVYVDDGEVV